MSTRKSGTKGQHSFAQIPKADIQRSSFNRSCGLKTTFDAGWLVPIFADEALPGDTMSLRMSTFARLATPLHPVMDNMTMDFFFFAVPNRLLWANWQKFNGEQLNPGDSTDFLIPTVAAEDPGGHAQGTLSDYLGIPTGIPGLVCSALWHRAYSFIWNEWFRDENLQDAALWTDGDGPDLIGFYALRRRGKRHDYFTSCLPWPQKGPAVQLPLGESAVVTMDSGLVPTQAAAVDGFPEFDYSVQTDKRMQVIQNTRNVELSNLAEIGGGPYPVAWGDNIGIEAELGGATGVADLSTATASTINAIRQAFQIQKLYERDARGGTRYTEILRSHFGVTSPDQRLQRPEYLGGGTQPIKISTVPQTSGTIEADDTPQGNLAAFGTSNGKEGVEEEVRFIGDRDHAVHGRNVHDEGIGESGKIGELLGQVPGVQGFGIRRSEFAGDH